MYRKVYETNPKTGKREVVATERYRTKGNKKTLEVRMDKRTKKNTYYNKQVSQDPSYEERKRYFDTGQYDPTSDNIPASGLVNVPTRKPFSVMSPKDKAKTVIGNLSKFSLLGNLLGLPERLLPQAPDINENYVGNVTTSPFSISPTSKPTGLLSVPTPTDLVQEVREEEVRKKYPTLTDEQITELAEAEQKIKDELYPEIKTYGTSLLSDDVARQIDEEQQMAINPYKLTQTMARPVDLGLLSGANIGAEYTTPFSQPVDYRVEYGSLGQPYDAIVMKNAQERLKEKGYQDLGIQGVTGNPLLPSSIVYQNIPIVGDVPKSANITANLLAYNPQTGQEVPDWALSESQRLRKNLYAQDIINAIADNSRVSNFNLLGY